MTMKWENDQADYKKWYHCLRSCTQDALDCLPERPETFYARQILRMALRETEELDAEGSMQQMLEPYKIYK